MTPDKLRQIGRELPRVIDPAHHENAMWAAKRLLAYTGDDPQREGLVDTPSRMVKSMWELFRGYHQDPEKILSARFSSDADQMVTLRNIEFFSTCEHHFLPFHGRAHIAYIPNGKVIGISKLARLVDCYSRRLQIQEQMTEQIAEAIQEHLEPVGVGVIVEAQHLCMVARGVEKQNAIMRTTALKGLLKEDHKAREEFLLCLK